MVDPLGSQVLSDLAGVGQARVVLHWLKCASCAQSAALRLLERHGGTIVHAADEESSGPEAQASSSGTTILAPGPFEELSAKRLVEESAKLQLSDPRRALELAAWAIRKAREQQEEDRETSAGDSARSLGAARALLGNTLRILGDPWSIEELSNWRQLGVRDGEAGLLRVIGLSYWEQGRPSEGGGALEQAAGLYATRGNHAEEGATRALLGLLRLEQGLAAESVQELAAGLSLLPPGRSEWLAARGTYGLAQLLAERGYRAPAMDLADTGRRLCLRVQGETASIDLYAVEARVEARLERWEQAADLLRSVLRKQVAMGLVAEAILARAELASALVASGDTEGASSLTAETWLSKSNFLAQDPQRRAAAAQKLLWELRWHGPRFRPFPFACEAGVGP